MQSAQKGTCNRLDAGYCSTVRLLCLLSPLSPLFGTEAAEKFAEVVQKNPDLLFLRQHQARFLYAPLTPCEVERLVSLLKAELEDCANIKLETVEKHLFVRFWSIIQGPSCGIFHLKFYLFHYFFYLYRYLNCQFFYLKIRSLLIT